MWSIQNELDFFNDAIRLTSIERLMVQVDQSYYAFSPRSLRNGNANTPQARNGLIGQRTEKWCKDLFSEIARENDLYAINGVVCEEIGLSRSSSADLAFCTTNSQYQRPENIKLLFEIKMGIVNNYVYNDNYNFEFCGDYTTHIGRPSLLRSDSMLKAIGKSINIRVDSHSGRKIPIIIIGNSPISSSYQEKVDCLCKSGVIQKFISLYPNPTDKLYIKETPDKGFQTFESIYSIESYISDLLSEDFNYFSSMMSNRELGRIISLANMELTEELKGQKFLDLLEK